VCFSGLSDPLLAEFLDAFLLRGFLCRRLSGFDVKRTPARTQIMLKVMQDVARITGITSDNIWVYLCNLEPTDM
jgi:hypothetical protein